MKNEEIRLATKAQAQAVREYLATLGVSLSHVQALEVIARGEGHRSRHLLANPAPASAAPTPALGAPVTVVNFDYKDANSASRGGKMCFRGRLTPEQLRFIASRLDEGEYFVPAQVGFEALQFAFTDHGAYDADHGWNRIQLWDEADWTLDAEGFVLDAGDVHQAKPGESFHTADADTDNLFFRFARVSEWADDVQHTAYYGGASSPCWRAPGVALTAGTPLAILVQKLRHKKPGLDEVDDVALLQTVAALLEARFSFNEALGEFQREISSNAYVYVKFGFPHDGDFAFDFDATTKGGTFLSENRLLWVSPGTAPKALSTLLVKVNELERSLRSTPAAWDAAFE